MTLDAALAPLQLQHRRACCPAEFSYVPSSEVRSFATAGGANAYDILDVTYTHVAADCSFDAFVRLHALDDPALARLATIVRGADTAAPHLAAESVGLLSVSHGLSALFTDDPTMLKWGMLVYDALHESRRAASVHIAARAGNSAVERA